MKSFLFHLPYVVDTLTGQRVYIAAPFIGAHTVHAEDLHAARTTLILWLDRNNLSAEYTLIGRGAGHFIDLSSILISQ